MSNKDIAKELIHCIDMYGHTDSLSDREYLGKIFYYSGLLAGQFL